MWMEMLPSPLRLPPLGKNSHNTEAVQVSPEENRLLKTQRD